MTTPLRYALVVVTAMVLQRGLFAELRIADAAPDVLLVVAVAAGIAGGPERGAVVGFFCGLALDLMLPSPLGLAALSYLAAGAAVGRVHSADHRAARWRVMALSALGCAFGVAVFAVLGTVLGQDGYITGHLATIALVVAVAGAVLGPLAVRVCRWAEDDADHLRPALR